MEILSKPKVRCKATECRSCGATFRPDLKDLVKFFKRMGLVQVSVSGCLCPFCGRKNEIETEEIPNESQ